MNIRPFVNGDIAAVRELLIILANDLDEAVEIYRLGDIIIGVEVVGLLQIMVFSGCRQDNYGNAAKVGIPLNPANTS